MPLYFFYTMVQKSQKWPKTQIKGVLKRRVRQPAAGSESASNKTTAKLTLVSVPRTLYPWKEWGYWKCSATAWHRSRASRFTLEVGHVQCFKKFYPGEAEKRRYLLPWTKKRTIIEIRGEKNAVPPVISGSIRHDQRRASLGGSEKELSFFFTTP